jgi:hypothetical protein
VRRYTFLFNNQPDALIIQIYSVIKLHVSGNFFARHQESPAVHSALVIFMQVMMTASKQNQEPHGASLLELSVLPLALYRVVIQLEQHRVSLPDVILHTMGAGDSTDMVYTTSKRTRSGKRYWSDKITSL